jgi:tetratricopeptide (TPR) repeat protein
MDATQDSERVNLAIKYRKILLGVCGICFFLQADNCHSPNRVLQQHLELQTPQSGYLLYPLVKRGNSDAMSALTKLAIDSDDQYWLALSGKLGSSGALYYSAMRSQNPTEIRAWLKKSAELGHTQSQFEYALLQISKDEKRRWMQKSAEAGYEPAIISMAKFIFESEDNSQALIWLKKAAEFDASSAFKLANLYWKKGKTEKAKTYFDKAAEQDFGSAKTALRVIKQHKIEPLRSLLNVPVQGPNCAQTIQFVATTLVSFIQATSFQEQFEKDKRLADLPLCVLPPIWLQKDSLVCSNNFNNEARLGCDLYPLSQLKTPLSFTHMIVFAEQGKANVNNGVMFLDQSDVYSVFVHELAHFAGFVDEYALPDDLANYHCSKNIAPNLLLSSLPQAVLNDQRLLEVKSGVKTPETQVDINTNSNENLSLTAKEVVQSLFMPASRANNWQRALDAHNELQILESTNPVLHHIARSRTCKNTQYESFKPTQQMTFLEYHDVPNIPKVYRTLWRQALLRQANYSALNDNLAISAFANNDDIAGLFWSTL